MAYNTRWITRSLQLKYVVQSRAQGLTDDQIFERYPRNMHLKGNEIYKLEYEPAASEEIVFGVYMFICFVTTIIHFVIP